MAPRDSPSVWSTSNLYSKNVVRVHFFDFSDTETIRRELLRVRDRLNRYEVFFGRDLARYRAREIQNINTQLSVFFHTFNYIPPIDRLDPGSV